MGFESPDVRLEDLLRQVESGALQLPDFQREYKWDDGNISSLLASLSKGYPIGVVISVLTGGDGARFKMRPLQGAPDNAANHEPSQVLIDGQQRLTTLYQALMSGKPVRTRDSRENHIERWYYIDIGRALRNDDREDAILTVPADRKVREDFGRKVVRDLSTDANECAQGLFPFRIAFDGNAKEDWSDQYKLLDPDNRTRWQEFRSKVLDEITNYTVPVIKLGRETSREAVCIVFEKVNTGGIPLTIFELLTASFANDPAYYAEQGKDFELGEDWRKIRAKLLAQDVLATFASEAGNPALLQTIALLVTRQRRVEHAQTTSTATGAPAISCKRSDILRLRLGDYLRWRDLVAEAYKWCGQFLNREYFFRARDVPYPSQLVPLAAMRVILGKKADHHGVYAKIRQWFWAGVLGEQYGGTTETKAARDLEQVLGWIAGERGEPETLSSAAFNPGRLQTLSTRQSAAYKGLFALIMANGCEDWLRHQRLDFAIVNELNVDVHHIFPREWCKKQGIRPRQYDSIVNKTAISFDTNRAIGDKSPADYLAYLQTKGGVDAQTIDKLVATHHVDPQWLRAANFEGFFADRTEQLLKLIEAAMGKPVLRRQEAAKNESDAS